MVERVQTETPPKSIPPGKLTFEQFMDWLDEDIMAEWVEGEVIMTSPASLQHQAIADFLYVVLRFLVDQRDLGRLISAPFAMRLGDRVREPDLLFVSAARLDRLQPTYLDGPADLVVEVVSPESAARDRGDKYYEYEAVGVREYWLLNPQRKWAEFYQLSDDGHFVLVLGGRDGAYTSPVLPGLQLDVAWLWQEPLPKVMDALKTMDAWE